MKQHAYGKHFDKTTCKKHFTWMGLALTVLLLAAGPAHALTPVTACGQTLSTADQYILASDLDCTGTLASGINITASNVSLYLAGHTLSSTDCDGTKSIGGIVVSSGVTGVQIAGGTIKGFNDGIAIAATSSRVTGVTVTSACFFGIAISGQGNRVDTSTVTLSGLDGVGIGAASGTYIVSNNISNNARVGVDISNFSNGNFVLDNIINNNGILDGEQGGVAIFNGSKNVIANNTVNNNFNGIEVESPGNTIRNNTVSGSLENGIFILAIGSPSNVKQNTVLGSALIDMSDDNAKCGKDHWKLNIFQSDLVAGVSDGGPGVGCIQ